jgi:hypothetical protein
MAGNEYSAVTSIIEGIVIVEKIEDPEVSK